MGRAMVNDGIGDAGKQAMRDFVSCEVPWYVQVTSGPSVYIPPLPESESKRKEWLLNMVLPLLRQEINEDAKVGDFDVFDAFSAALRFNLLPLQKAS